MINLAVVEKPISVSELSKIFYVGRKLSFLFPYNENELFRSRISRSCVFKHHCNDIFDVLDGCLMQCIDANFLGVK